MEPAPEMPRAQRQKQMPKHPKITFTWKKHRLKGQQNGHLFKTCTQTHGSAGAIYTLKATNNSCNYFNRKEDMNLKKDTKNSPL